MSQTGIEPAAEGTPVRPGTVLENLIQNMDGTKTIDEITEEIGFRDKKDASHRIRYVLGRVHGIGHKVDRRGRIKVLLPRNLTKRSVVGGNKEAA